MTIVRWAPFQELNVLRRQMDQLFEDVLSEPPQTMKGEFMPAVEFREQPDVFILRAALPGIKAEDVDVQATPEALTISAEHRYSKQDEQEVAHRSEFRYGKFFRQVALPTRIDPDQVQAKFEDGILTLTLPKVARAGVRKVPVAVATPVLPAQ